MSIRAPVRTSAGGVTFQRDAGSYWRDSLSGKSRVLIDPAELDPTGLTAIEWISPAPDGRLLAYGTYRAGDENTTLRLIEVDTRRELPVHIPNRTQAPDWLPDGSGFVYQNLKHAKDPYSSQIVFHRVDQDVSRDVVLWVDREAGHGQGKPLNLRLRDVVDQRLFAMWQLGVPQ